MRQLVNVVVNNAAAGGIAGEMCGAIIRSSGETVMVLSVLVTMLFARLMSGRVIVVYKL